MPPRPVTYVSTSDPRQALAWFARLIEREPVALSVIASAADGFLADPNRYIDPRWWAGREDGPSGDVVAAFMHTPPHPVHIGRGTPEQARVLAHELAEAGHEAPGVGGHGNPATAFAQEWAALRGTGLVTRMELGVYDLPGDAVAPFEVAGAARLAGDDDVDLVDDWMGLFAIEVYAGNTHAAPARAPGLAPAVRAGRVLLWEQNGIPVSMAYASVPNGGVVRVSGVWTPGESRRHGYASAVVAELSRRQTAAGHHCLLFTDLANPTSNAIYQAIGYRRIGDHLTIGFDAAPG